MEEKKEQLNKDFLVKNYALGIQPSFDEVFELSVPTEQKIQEADVQKIKNAGLFSRVFNHLAAGASLGFYNPYNVPADIAEQQSWFYKRIVRIPFIEDIISPYGFSLAGMIEFLPILLYSIPTGGGAFATRPILSGASKVLTSGIRLSEKAGATILEKTAGFLASKIPALETKWLSLSPQVRRLGYEFIKKDLQFAPWVAGTSYREKMLSGEETSRVGEYLSALYNPANLFFAGAFTGIEARLAARGLMASGKTFWQALGDLQVLDDLRLPTVKNNIENLIKDGLVEKNPLATKSLYSYIRNLSEYIDNKALDDILNISKLSNEVKQEISRGGLVSYIRNKLDEIPFQDAILSKIVDDPVRFLRDDYLKQVSNKNIFEFVAKYNDRLSNFADEAGKFFDYLSQKDDIIKMLSKNPDIAFILSKPEPSIIDKLSVVNFFIKQKDLVSRLSVIPEVSDFMKKSFSFITEASNIIDNLYAELQKLNPNELLSLRNQIYGNKYLIPIGENMDNIQQVSPNVLISKEFINDIMTNLKSGSFVSGEGIRNLIRSRELTDFLRNNMTQENFAKIAKDYPNFVFDDAIKLENISELSKVKSYIDNSIAKKTKETEEIVNNIVEKQYIKLGSGIEKDDGIQLVKDVNFLLRNPYDILTNHPVFKSLDDDYKKIIKRLFDPLFNEEGLYAFEYEKFGKFSPLSKFILNTDIIKGEVLTNPNLAVLKAATNAVDYLLLRGSDLSLVYKTDIVNYYIGKKTFNDISKTLKIIWDEMKEFNLVHGGFSKKNFYEQLFALYEKDYSNIINKEVLEEIYSAKQFVNNDFYKYIKEVYSKATPEEVSKILENEAILRKNLLEDELRDAAIKSM